MPIFIPTSQPILMKYFLTSIFFLFSGLGLHAQFTVTTNTNANALAQKIVGQGVTILNPIFKGSAVSAGFFNDRTGTIGIDSGIVLTTGRAASMGGIGINGSASQSASNQTILQMMLI